MTKRIILDAITAAIVIFLSWLGGFNVWNASPFEKVVFIFLLVIWQTEVDTSRARREKKNGNS